jgi:CO/xanthine dehydrogenase FAD-binding subunit
VEFLQPASLEEALSLKAEHPEAVPIMGGTDVLVELNFDRRRPDVILDLARVRELDQWDRVPANGQPESIRLGAGVTFTRLIAQLAAELPGLAIASRTVGSPQIRNRGTVGGNLGTASPAGDALPPLVAARATVEVASADAGTRTIPVESFIEAPKRSALRPGELIAAVHVPVATGAQQFSKIGTRNAMVIAVASFAIALHDGDRSIGTGIGSAGPTPIRATEAEQHLAAGIAKAGLWDEHGPLPEGLAQEFGELVADAASPIDDVRGTAAYRRHALSVMAQRTLGWVWADRQSGGN